MLRLALPLALALLAAAGCRSRLPVDRPAKPLVAATPAEAPQAPEPAPAPAPTTGLRRVEYFQISDG